MQDAARQGDGNTNFFASPLGTSQSVAPVSTGALGTEIFDQAQLEASGTALGSSQLAAPPLHAGGVVSPFVPSAPASEVELRLLAATGSTSGLQDQEADRKAPDEQVADHVMETAPASPEPLAATCNYTACTKWAACS